MKKRTCLSLCAAVLSALLLQAAFPAAVLTTETILLADGEPYITAIAGETVDLSRYSVSLDGATAEPESLIWKNGDQTVASCGQRRKAASSGKTSWKKKGCNHSDCPNGTGLET